MIIAFAEQRKTKTSNTKQIVIGNLEVIYDSLIYQNNPNITPIR